MTDMLLQLSKNPFARKLVASAGLPIPMPQELVRPSGPATERFLEGKSVRVAGEGALTATLAQLLPRAGASVQVASAHLVDTFAKTAEAYGRPVSLLPPTDPESTAA